MNLKGIKGFVLLLSITLVCPPSSSAVKAPPRRTSSKTQVPANRKVGVKDHLTPTSISPQSSSLRQANVDKRHHHQASDNRETPLVRLKRIKREVVAFKNQHSFGNDEKTRASSPHLEAPHLKTPEISSLKDARQTDATALKVLTGPGVYRDYIGSKIHSQMSGKAQDANRKMSYGDKGRPGKVPSTKANDIAERFHKGALHRSAGTGSYIHHKHEQERLESLAEAAMRQRNRKKNKHQKNRSEFNIKGSSGRNYALISRPRQFGSQDRVPEEQRPRFHDSAGGRTRGRGHADSKGQGIGEAKRRTRRGQRSEMAATKAAGQAPNVRTELEQIRRMQRDLLREINHLEHMKKKKKQRRSASSQPNQSQQKSAIQRRK